MRMPVQPFAPPTGIPKQERTQHKSVLRQASFVSSPDDPHVLIWLISDKWHTGTVFPYQWLLESGYIPPAGFGTPQFVTMSWGNTDAYSTEGINKPFGLLEILFTPTDSVMELIAFDWSPAEVSPRHRIWRRLTPRSQGPELAAFLNGCAVQDAKGRPVVVRPASWGRGVQLQSRYSYFIPRVCNVWTAQAIGAIGGDINPWWGLTANGLIRQAEKPPNDFEEIWSGGGMDPETRLLPRTSE